MTLQSPPFVNSLDRPLAAELDVYALGILDFEAWRHLQELLLFQLSGKSSPTGALLLFELPPMITIGREGSSGQLQASHEDLTRMQIPVRWINRGGDSCVHQPGQLVICPLFPYKKLQIGPYETLSRIEHAVASACRGVKVPVESRGVGRGLWTSSGQVMWTGLSTRWGYTFQGCFLNVDNDLRLSRLVNTAQGRNNSSTLASCRLRPLSMGSVREAVISHLAEQFGFASVNFFSTHPLLKRTKQKTHAFARHH